MSQRSKYDINAVVEGIARNVLDGAGSRPIVFLDSGAIIDFEREVLKKWRLSDVRAASSETFYGLLSDRIPGLFVSEHIIGEVRPHCECNTINGRPEVSDQTIYALGKLHESYCGFIRDISGTGIEMDLARYQTFHASSMAFEKDHKKSCLDPISRTDKELIALALWSKYTCSPSYFDQNVPVSQSVIISPDNHIIRTIGVLSGKNFDHNGLRVVNSREVCSKR